MRFSPLAFLLASAGIGLSSAAEECPPKPEPIRHIKFTDTGASDLHNYELHGTARIVEPAPEPVARALRIDQIYSYALLKDLDISPSKMKDTTLAIGVYIESIRPMHADGIRKGAKETQAHGWIMGHDNGGFDRAIFLHDERFNGMGISPGYKFPANTQWTPPILKKWMQIVAIWRQGGECELYQDKQKVQFSQQVIGKNNNGLPDLSIGSLQARRYGAANDNDVWIKDVQVFDWALDEDELDAMDCNFEQNLEPTIDCGDGGELVESCTECPIEEGSATGCKGDCMWDGSVPICKEDPTDEPQVDCGDHQASDCGSCDATSADTSGCAGECAWIDGECKDNDYVPPEDPVQCGEHEAPTCADCPNGDGASGCAGECMWHKATSTCKPDTPDVNCGDHDAPTCNGCDATAEDPSGCSGDCVWDAGKDICKKPTPVDCGDHQANSCDECPSDDGPLGCAGECNWDRMTGACVPDDPRDDDVDCGDHHAASCGDCVAGKYDPSGCSGDCEWNEMFDSCVKPPSEDDCDVLCPNTDPTPGPAPVDPKPAPVVPKPAPPAPKPAPVVIIPTVDCGDGVEKATCNQCNLVANGIFATGCKGECLWDPSSNKCVDDNDFPDINCGDHHAKKCGDCQATAQDTSKCAGECKWVGGQCRDDDYIPPVNCGLGKTAESCSQCTTGPGQGEGCHGDCVYSSASKLCYEKPIDHSPANCGNHQAVTCGLCAGGQAGCKGECKWFAGGNFCAPPGFKPVACNDGTQATSCDKCGSGPKNCGGDCEWHQQSNTCKPRPSSKPAVVVCGNHRARTCNQCGSSPMNGKISGYYYSADYRPEYHEILKVTGPYGGEQKLNLIKTRGDPHVPKQQTSIEAWYNKPAWNSWRKNTQITNAYYRKTYCQTGITKYPARIKVAARGFTHQAWRNGYIAIFHGDAFVFISHDTTKHQLYFKRATDAQKKKYMRWWG